MLLTVALLASAGVGATTSATAVSGGGSGAATAWPSASGSQSLSSTQSVSGSFDGGMKRYVGTGSLGSGGDGEGKDPLFKLANGATLSNVIIGSPASDGVHCTGTCTLKNVWWEDVLDDAATQKGTSNGQVMTIDGGGAQHASDKVFQHNGPGTMIIRNFQVSDFGKLYRSCGNCKSQYQRSVQVSNVTVTAPGKVLAGINTNYGDTASFSNITIVGDSSKKIKICEFYTGNSSGDEPTKTGSGSSGNGCSSSGITYQ